MYQMAEAVHAVTRSEYETLADSSGSKDLRAMLRATYRGRRW
jgi:hypothetical protein